MSHLNQYLHRHKFLSYLSLYVKKNKYPLCRKTIPLIWKARITTWTCRLWASKDIGSWSILAFSNLRRWGFDLILAARWFVEGKGVASATLASFIHSFSHPFGNYSLTSTQATGVQSSVIKSERQTAAQLLSAPKVLCFYGRKGSGYAFASVNLARMAGWIHGSTWHKISTGNSCGIVLALELSQVTCS